MLRAIVREFDGFLRRRLNVTEFSADPECILRIRLACAPHELALPGSTVPAGAPVIELHIWNEHVPPMPSSGPDLAWARDTTRRISRSLGSLAEHILDDPSLLSARALGGATPLVSLIPSHGGGLATRMGFSLLPYHHPLGRFGEFWENSYTWILMWTFNQASLRRRTLLGMRRTEMWMTTEDYLRRYGPRGNGAHRRAGSEGVGSR
jgi:hypothetical protein